MHKIDDNVKDIRDEMLKRVVPDLAGLSRASDTALGKIDSLVAEMNRNEGIRKNISSEVKDPVYFLTEIANIFSKNSDLNIQITKLTAENAVLKAEIKQLTATRPEEKVKTSQNIEKYMSASDRVSGHIKNKKKPHNHDYSL